MGNMSWRLLPLNRMPDWPLWRCPEHLCSTKHRWFHSRQLCPRPYTCWSSLGTRCGVSHADITLPSDALGLSTRFLVTIFLLVKPSGLLSQLLKCPSMNECSDAQWAKLQVV